MSLTEELVDPALNGYPALDLSTVIADEEFVCTPEEVLPKLLRDKGLTYKTQVYKSVEDAPGWMDLKGGRFQDLELYDSTGKAVGSIELKSGGSPYTWEQHVKDQWIAKWYPSQYPDLYAPDYTTCLIRIQG